MDVEARVDHMALERFCQDIFACLGLVGEDAAIAASVLVAADMRGIPSHGVARLPRYVRGLKLGLMRVDAVPEVVHETATTLVIDAHGAMGAPVSVRTMRQIMHKAQETGVAFGAVRDSNHFGIAGYYAMLALEADLIGLAMTNTAALGVPTFGCSPMFGTNPLAFAAPADEERAFVLDMATTVVTRGKIELYDREGKRLPEGWAVDEAGRSATVPAPVLERLTYQQKGGILPLGGLGELLGGHKGYGLAVMVDVLCGVLSGGAFGPDIVDVPGSAARVSHFFGALQIEAFRDPQEFRRDMDRLLRLLRSAPPAVGHERVYFAGQKEREREEINARRGVPLPRNVYAQLCELGSVYGVPAPELISG